MFFVNIILALFVVVQASLQTFVFVLSVNSVNSPPEYILENFCVYIFIIVQNSYFKK